MIKVSRLLLLAAITIGIGACGANEEIENQRGTDTEQQVDEERNEPDMDMNNDELVFDEQMEDTIRLEGMEESITMNLYRPVDAPFLTYVPEDLLVEEVSGGEGDAYYFYANYENEKVEDVYLQIYFFSENIIEQPSADKEDSTYGVAAENMEQVEKTAYYEWAIEEYMSPEGSRIVALGEHEMKYFMVVMNSTVEYSEGFVPRANKVLEHLYWLATEEYLVE